MIAGYSEMGRCDFIVSPSQIPGTGRYLYPIPAHGIIVTKPNHSGVAHRSLLFRQELLLIQNNPKQCYKSCSAPVLVARNEGSNPSSDKGKSVVSKARKDLLSQQQLCPGGKETFQGYPVLLKVEEFQLF